MGAGPARAPGGGRPGPGAYADVPRCPVPQSAPERPEPGGQGSQGQHTPPPLQAGPHGFHTSPWGSLQNLPGPRGQDPGPLVSLTNHTPPPQRHLCLMGRRAAYGPGCLTWGPSLCPEDSPARCGLSRGWEAERLDPEAHRGWHGAVPPGRCAIVADSVHFLGLCTTCTTVQDDPAGDTSPDRAGAKGSVTSRTTPGPGGPCSQPPPVRALPVGGRLKAVAPEG